MTARKDVEKLSKHAPWKPPSYEPADAAAIQALGRGTATPDQQKRAINWIITDACGTYQPSYRPGPEGERDTAFAEGKRSVGLQLVFMLKIKIGLITRRQP